MVFVLFPVFFWGFLNDKYDHPLSNKWLEASSLRKVLKLAYKGGMSSITLTPWLRTKLVLGGLTVTLA